MLCCIANVGLEKLKAGLSIGNTMHCITNVYLITHTLFLIELHLKESNIILATMEHKPKMITLSKSPLSLHKKTILKTNHLSLYRSSAIYRN